MHVPVNHAVANLQQQSHMHVKLSIMPHHQASNATCHKFKASKHTMHHLSLSLWPWPFCQARLPEFFFVIWPQQQILLPSCTSVSYHVNATQLPQHIRIKATTIAKQTPPQDCLPSTFPRNNTHANAVSL